MGTSVVTAAKRRSDDESGFAAVDALVALTTLATAITFCLRAVETAQQAALAADETVQATQMLRGLVDARPSPPGVVSGRSPQFLWRIETKPVAPATNPNGMQLCERSASLVSVRSQRRYALSSAYICKTAS
jgi:hypothetical protein